MTINSIEGYLDNGKFYNNVPYYANVTIKAPEGKVFPILTPDVENWLCECNISGGKVISFEQSADLTELTVVIKTLSATDCLHENVTMKEAGKLATCTEDGVKDKYACEGCGKEFFDAACTIPWNDSVAKIPAAGHKFSSIYTVGKDTHFYECKTCGEKADEAPHDFSKLVGQTNSTCMQNGVKAHYECSACKKLVDENKQETTLEDLKLPVNPGGHNFGEWIDEIPAATEVFGTKGHKDCTVCGKHFDNNGNQITELRIAKIGTHNVVINGESKFYAHGESITVTADEPAEGKVFEGWKDASGNTVSTDAEYTFTVTSETTLTAVYEDVPEVKPNKNEGLSGGAIAGIVIGSLAGAGLIGFAIFWLAVKKKSFADFIVAIKKIGKEKQ